MDNAYAGRDDAEAVKGAHSPFEKAVAFGVAFEFDGHVEPKGVGGGEVVDLDGVVDYQVDGYQRFDGFRRFVVVDGGVAHGGKVGEQGDAGEVL